MSHHASHTKKTPQILFYPVNKHMIKHLVKCRLDKVSHSPWFRQDNAIASSWRLQILLFIFRICRADGFFLKFHHVAAEIDDLGFAVVLGSDVDSTTRYRGTEITWRRYVDTRSTTLTEREKEKGKK